MLRFVRQLSVVLLLAMILNTSFASSPAPQASAPSTGETPTAAFYPEVRLRKLHLVRPDLIPYPIAYEVVC